MILFSHYEGDDLDKISDVFESNNKIKCITIGALNLKQIAFFKEKCPEVFDRIKSYAIFIWRERLEHIKKHSYDALGLSVKEMVDLLPSIIETPDYLGYRTKDNSIQFIKAINGNLLVAVRADSNGRLNFRTMYTITDGQLEDYVRKNHAWKFSLDNKSSD